MVPVSALSDAARSGLSMARIAGPSTFSIDGMTIQLAVNPRLTIASWTDKFVVVRTDGSIKPLIRQEENRDASQGEGRGIGIRLRQRRHPSWHRLWRNVGYGRWQGACQVTLT